MHASPSSDDAASLPPSLRELADALSTGVLLLDADGVVRWANAAEDARWAAVRGRDFFRDLAPALEGDGLGPAFRAGMADGSVQTDAEVLLAGDRGGTRFVRVILRTARWRRRTWGLAMLEDRTELIGERERRKAAEREAAVGRLAATLPHEVNNPVAAIRSFAQLLMRDAAGTAECDALRAIVAGCDRIGGLMDGLVVTLRRHAADDRVPVELNEVIRRILAVRAYALEALGVEIRLDLQEPLSPVTGERGALAQMMLELLLRSERDLSARPAQRLLVLRTREATRGVTVTVFDNGPGMSRDRLLRVFDAAEDDCGAGLGLSVVAGIVRDHGGDIRMESEEGRNTTVVAHLPRCGEAPLVPADEPPVDETPAVRPDAAPRPLRVLIADDEPALRLALRLYLQRRGHAVVEAADAMEAWERAQAERFDVALVDARMPGDGLQLLTRLESLPSLRGRTALMTGDLGRARESPDATTARPMLAKPFELTDMARLLERLGNEPDDPA